MLLVMKVVSPVTVVLFAAFLFVQPEAQEDEKEDVCSLPTIPGNCFAYFPRWSYSQKRGVCRQFVYGGCGGNDNRFGSREECEAKCGEAVDVCVLPMTTGPCQAYMPSWGFDVNVNGCREFGYGGCHGNGNRFATKEACMDKCPPTS